MVGLKLNKAKAQFWSEVGSQKAGDSGDQKHISVIHVHIKDSDVKFC